MKYICALSGEIFPDIKQAYEHIVGEHGDHIESEYILEVMT